jgi:hypothetical protein
MGDRVDINAIKKLEKLKAKEEIFFKRSNQSLASRDNNRPMVMKTPEQIAKVKELKAKEDEILNSYL